MGNLSPLTGSAGEISEYNAVKAILGRCGFSSNDLVVDDVVRVCDPNSICPIPKATTDLVGDAGAEFTYARDRANRPLPISLEGAGQSPRGMDLFYWADFS
ncbi:hypothetical protein TorRG33x02_299470, partial [Trema orientale]